MRVKAFRGPQVGAGAVVLTVLVALLNERFAQDWGDGVHFVYTALAAAFVLVLGLSSPMEAELPRPYQTALYVSGFALALGTLVDLARLLDASGAGTVMWIAALLTAVGMFLAVARHSPTATLLAGVSAAVTAIAFANWVADPSLQTIRWILLGVIAAAVFGALEQRDHRPAHAVQLVNIVGLAVLAIGITAIIAAPFSPFLSLFGSAAGVEGVYTRGVGADGVLGWGWQLVLVVGGCGLLAYGGVEYVRGPAVLGVATLGTFVVLAGEGDLLGWPLVLALAAGMMLIIGLRPTHPLPPPPDVGPGADVTSIPRP